MLVLLVIAFWLIYEAICFKSCPVLFCSCFFFFSTLSIAVNSLWEERANLSGFRLFDLRLFDFVCFLLPSVSGMGSDL